MADVQSGLATLGPYGWDVQEPSEGGRFGGVAVGGGWFGAKRASRSYGQQYQTAASPTFDARTWHLGVVAEAPFIAARIRIQNAEAAGYTFTGASLAASDSITSTTPSGAWNQVTFGGSASVAVPARLAAGRPSTVYSDWIPVQSIQQAVGPLYPLHVRSYIAAGPFSVSGANTTLSDLNGGTASPLAKGRFVSTSYKTGGDFATTNQAGYTGVTVTNLSPILEVEFLSASGTVSVLGLGDSIMAGVGGTVGLCGAGHYACADASAGGSTKFFWDNQSVPSTTSAQWVTRFDDMISAGKRPDILVYAPWTPNDGTPDASNTAAAKRRLLYILDQCRIYGVKPILLTACPNTAAAYDTTADGFRRSVSDFVRAIPGVEVVDQDAILSDGATPSRYIAAYTTDGTHPNDAGHQAVGAALKAALLN